MAYANPEALVSAEWLAKNLKAPDLRVVDATWYLPNDGRNGIESYKSRHIPGAVFFDIDEISDTQSDLPHMLPSAEQFAAEATNLGLGDGAKIVVYDANGGFMAACRVWWMFRVFGHENVAVLDGGLPSWLAQGFPVDDQNTPVQQGSFTASKNDAMVRNIDQLMTNLESRDQLVVDVRSPGRFKGTEPEPRASLRGGRIPESVNVPIPMIMDPKKSFTIRTPEEIQSNLDSAGVDLSKPIIASCGSGVTACVVNFGLYLMGHENVAVYDGSWTEWGGRKDTPVSSG